MPGASFRQARRMLTVCGEVRKVLDDDYRNRDGQTVKQAVVIIEPENQRQNHEIYLSSHQVKAGARDAWLKLRGQQASVAVSLFVNWEYRFYKFNAVGNGLPHPKALER